MKVIDDYLFTVLNCSLKKQKIFLVFFQPLTKIMASPHLAIFYFIANKQITVKQSGLMKHAN